MQPVASRQGLGELGRTPSHRTARSLAGDFATSQHQITPSTLEFRDSSLILAITGPGLPSLFSYRKASTLGHAW